jgi:ABC-type transport system substrate-binding protein
MSVVRNFHERLLQCGKIILAHLCFAGLAISVIYMVLGNYGCKNVDNYSDSLIFRYNEDVTLATLDPAFIKSQSEIWVAQQIYNGLVELDTALKPTPSLAYRWEVSADGLVYKFFLRKDAGFLHPRDSTFFNVTSKDVAFSFRRIASPATASPSAWIFSGKVDTDYSKAFQTVGDSVFVLRLLSPDPTILSLLGTVYCSIIPEKYVTNTPDFGHQPIGTGPFYLKYWEEDVKLVLRKNPRYFEKDNGKSLPYLEAVNVDFMQFVAGKYDFFNGVEGSFKDELLTRDGLLNPKYQGRFGMMKKPFLNTEYLGFWLGDSVNQQPNPLVNVHLRRALALGVDRKAMIRYLRNGLGEAGNHGFVPPVLLNNPSEGLIYHPAKARKELELSGYPQGKGLPELLLTTTADYLDMAVFLKKAWSDMGIRVKIDVQTGGMLRQMRNKGNLAIFRGSWIADVPDAENYLACFYSGNFSPNGPNYTHFSQPQFDALYKRSFSETGAVRIRSMEMADSILIQSAPLLVLYYDQSLRLYGNRVKGLSNDASNRLILKRVKKTTNP